MNLSDIHFCGDSHAVEFCFALRHEIFSFKNLGSESILSNHYSKSLRPFSTDENRYLDNVSKTDKQYIVYIHSDVESRIVLGENPDLKEYGRCVVNSLRKLKMATENKKLLFFDLYGIHPIAASEQTCSPEKRIQYRRFLNQIVKSYDDILFYSADEDRTISDENGFVLDKTLLPDRVHFNDEETYLYFTKVILEIFSSK